MRPYALVGRKHPALHQQADEIEEIDQEIIDLASRLLATVRVQHGMAIAAPQVGIPLQLVVLHNGNALANPSVEVTKPDDEDVIGLEGCLSIPGRQFKVPRPKEVQISGTTFDTKDVDLVVRGVDARMWCHELDHLSGVLISDRYEEVRGGPRNVF